MANIAEVVEGIAPLKRPDICRIAANPEDRIKLRPLALAPLWRHMCRIAVAPEDRMEIRSIVYVTDNFKPEYASTWFATPANDGSKPQVTLPTVTAARTLAALRMSVKHRIATNAAVLHESMLYIELAISRITSPLEANWTSFGRVIGAANAQVALSDLYNRVNGEDPWESVQGVAATERDDLWMIMYLVSIYRICNTKYKDYRQIVCAEINASLRSRGAPKQIDITNVYKHYKIWIWNQWFCALIASVDMYMSKFPFHVLAEVRIGTITSRFRDFSALMDLVFLTETLDADISEVSAWIWSNNVADDFQRVLKDGEEIDKMDSYTPYLTDLRLSMKSPYSASSNPSLHFWVNIIGVCLGAVRSHNARIDEYLNFHGLTIHGIICGYAYRSRTEAKRLCSDQGLRAPAMPNDLNGDSWLGWLKKAKFGIPPEACQLFSNVFARLHYTRDGTVGRFAYKYVFPE